MNNSTNLHKVLVVYINKMVYSGWLKPPLLPILPRARASLAWLEHFFHSCSVAESEFNERNDLK